jgi:hypothetical protein
LPPSPCQTNHMKRLIATICLTSALLLGSVGMSWSADFQKDWTAYGTAIILSAIPSVLHGLKLAKNRITRRQ